tara:strand:+ start:5245 stop:5772 length:528 start_codon:yes stop_codon:yes gene_type:complete
MGTLKTTNIQSISGSGTVTLGTSGETFTVPNGVTVAGGLTNTPMWYAKSAANQTGIATATATKLTYGTEVIDTDSAFATSKFTVPASKAGKYFIKGTITWSSGAWTSQQILYIYKNGANAYAEYRYKDATDMGMEVTAVLDLAVSDYIEIYCYQPSGSSRDTWSSPYSFFGYKLT